MPEARPANTDSDQDILVKAIRSFPKSWGCEYIRDRDVIFRLWAPEAESVLLRIHDTDTEMQKAGDGWHELLATAIAPETRYQFVLPDGRAVPDPASRMQDGGIEAASIVTDPTSYRWQNRNWQGLAWEDAVIYELHIGTFTPEGTFRSAIGKLSYLADLGITCIEVMPVAQFAGHRGWGYDGVLLYAPHHAYGTPDDFKAFIDAAHGYGLMVLLDVVYNHFGPEGNYLFVYAKSFFSPDLQTPWGGAIDFTERPVREFVIENALYWLLEFNLDGLRIDAVHAIEDEASDIHILTELSNRVREECAGRRRHLVIEDSRNIIRFLKRQNDLATEIDAGWNDDFHHAAHVIATGETGGYLANFAQDTFRKLGVALSQGYVLAGDEPVKLSATKTVPAPALMPPTAYVTFVQNHDQIGNRAYGDRINESASPDMIEVLETIMMLSPSIPLLFMGQEYDEKRPFQFFCDYTGDLATAFRAGRLEEAITFGSLPENANEHSLPDPNADSTFENSKLNWKQSESERGRLKREFMRALICKRTQQVTPGLKGAKGQSGTLHMCDDGVLAIDWSLNGFRWQLRANLTNGPARLPAFEGHIVHIHPETANASDGMIGPMTVLFSKRDD